ncbi:CLUMA_CG019781, isoform A [Clunio marinus]|uniref:CLUMA_CG019781, isoform A n=1 Tax=Clunio marinus TaxID=568069 RepID=A0A1J1J5L6_9DIPT|nr:CLUMA_CG019781, isoform A [Clunio marinus]
MEEKLIRNLKDKKREADENRKSLNKRLRKILSKNHCMHEQLQDVDENKTKSDDAYLRSGIYDKFGNSCTESLKQYEPVKQEVEAEDLTSASWYHSRIIGKFSEEILHHQSPGSFIIHKASHKSANFILSLRVPSKTSKVVHHLIVQSKRGYRLKGATKNFSTITSLVTHHSVMAEQLPVALSLQRTYDLVYKTVNEDDFSSTENLGIIFTDLEV